MRRTRLFLAFLLLSTLALALLLRQGLAASAAATRNAEAKRQLVQRLGLTDLSLWSEARYTRHPSQADLFSPFQDYPGAFDHFPAASIIAPAMPRPTTSLRLRRKGEG